MLNLTWKAKWRVSNFQDFFFFFTTIFFSVFVVWHSCNFKVLLLAGNWSSQLPNRNQAFYNKAITEWKKIEEKKKRIIFKNSNNWPICHIAQPFMWWVMWSHVTSSIDMSGCVQIYRKKSVFVQKNMINHGLHCFLALVGLHKKMEVTFS